MDRDADRHGELEGGWKRRGDAGKGGGGTRNVTDTSCISRTPRMETPKLSYALKEVLQMC